MVSAALTTAAADLMAAEPDAALPPLREVSIWEICQFILRMAPEHFRRVLRANPGLPQGRAGVEGGTRWFTFAEVDRLRAHFAARGSPGRYRPLQNGPAPLVVLAAPQGRAGKSTALAHLAVGAVLAGWRVLAIDADPAGVLHATFGTAAPRPPGDGVLPLIARSFGSRLRQLNETRLERGEMPLPMDETVTRALAQPAAALVGATAWPGLDLLPAGQGLIEADPRIAGWRAAAPTWAPWQALADALERDGMRARYDLILCDTGPGLGPLALAVLASADLLLAPLAPGGATAAGHGLGALGRSLAVLAAEQAATARALGRPPPRTPEPDLRLLVIRQAAAAAPAASGRRLLAALPDLPAPLFYAADYRSIGRADYVALRTACDAAWRGLAVALPGGKTA